MNSIQTPSWPREKKRFFFLFLLCSLALTSVALGGTFLIRFEWPSTFHQYTNNPTSAVLEAEWIVYPNGLPPENDFYLTATTPHMVDTDEIRFRYWPDHKEFIYSNNYWNLDDRVMAPYIGTRVINGQSFSVLRYQLSNRRSPGPIRSIDLVCSNHSGAIAPASDGATLPQSTIYVNTYPGYPAFPTSGGIQIVTSTGSPSIHYHGTTVNQSGATTSFTNCTGGSGTLTAGNAVAELSGNTSSATHFRNTVYLWNYAANPQRWDIWYDQEFDHTALAHDCTACGNVCAFWGPTFESNFNPCHTGVLPPIGVVDWLVSIDDGRLVRGDASNSFLVETLGDCNQNPPYQLISYLPNYQWIIQSTP